MEKLSEKSDEELNRMVAEAMGWHILALPISRPGGGCYDCWHSGDKPAVSVAAWRPATDLNHAFLLATGDYWLQLNTIRHAQIWRWGGIVAEVPLKDGTPEGIARAITVCFLRANGVEEDDDKAIRHTLRNVPSLANSQ